MEIMMLYLYITAKARDHVHEQLLKRPQVHQDSDNYKCNGHFCIRGNAQYSALLVYWINYSCSLLVMLTGKSIPVDLSKATCTTLKFSRTNNFAL